jgi:hypothetical protein
MELAIIMLLCLKKLFVMARFITFLKTEPICVISKTKFLFNETFVYICDIRNQMNEQTF